jgi:hypothetical protein
MTTNPKDEKQYWLMIPDPTIPKYSDQSDKTKRYCSYYFNSLAEMIIWASDNNIKVNGTKIVIGYESKLKLELV